MVALSTPTEREKTQMSFQRYMPHLPAGSEVTLFDCSWYNRAGVERMMGRATAVKKRNTAKLTLILPPLHYTHGGL